MIKIYTKRLNYKDFCFANSTFDCLLGKSSPDIIIAIEIRAKDSRINEKL